MSSIETYLQYIASKVWAREVRTAIVNAIRQCYDDVHNPTLNTEALQAAIQAKIDAGQMAALTIGDRTITAAKLALGVIPTPDATLSQSGVPADAKTAGDEITALKADLGAQTGVISLIKDYYIKTSTTPISLTPISSSAGRMYAVVDCTAGDKFVINAYSDSSQARAWCFIDSANNAISMAEALVNVTDLELTAPNNAAKLIINDMRGGMSYKVGNNLASKVYYQKGLSPEIANVLLSYFYHTYSDDEFGEQYFNRLKRMLNTVKYHWKSTDSDAVIMKGLLSGFTVDDNDYVKLTENTTRAIFCATHGEIPVFNSDGVTLSNYYPILIPEDAKTVTTTKTDSSFDISTLFRRYSGKENEMLWTYDSGWKNDNVRVVPIPVYTGSNIRRRGRANIMWLHIKKTDNSEFSASAVPVIDILFE